MENIKLNIPDQVSYILNKLNEAGYEAFIVGGCVRDALLEREPNDWDITTSALPAQVKEVFRKTIDTGIKHGTVTVLLREGQYEVTTYRIDGLYEDSRHPKAVTFTSNLEEDLRRRDFTINAMAYHPAVGIVDPYGGMEDLAEGVIRAVGVPSERFDEDALRIMRAVRFSAQLGFAIDPETALALKGFAGRLSLISHERIRDELVKLVTSPYPETFKVLYDMGITAVIIPEFDKMMATRQDNPKHIFGVGEHTLACMESVAPTVRLRMAALLHDIGKPETGQKDADGCDIFPDHHIKGAEIAHRWMREYRFDNATIKDVTTLIRYHDFLFPRDEIGVRKVMSHVGDLFPDLLALMRADCGAKSATARDIKLPIIDELERIYHEVLERGDCVSLKGLAIGGSDLIAAGVPAGPALGKVLGALLDEVIEEPARNSREWLLDEGVRLAGELN